MEHKLPELPLPRMRWNQLFQRKHSSIITENIISLRQTSISKLKVQSLEDMPLEEIIKKSEGGIFNNAAQVWNHTFY